MQYVLLTQSVVPKPPSSGEREMWNDPETWTLKVLNELCSCWMWDKHSVPAYSEPGTTTRAHRGILPSTRAKISNWLNPHSNSGSHIFCHLLTEGWKEKDIHMATSWCADHDPSAILCTSRTPDLQRMLLLSLFLSFLFDMQLKRWRRWKFKLRLTDDSRIPPISD